MNSMLTKAETAALLEVSPRTVENYVRRGLLRKYKEKNRVVFLHSDVEELRRDRVESITPLVDRRTIADLLRRVRKLEHRVQLSLDLHELHEDPFDDVEDLQLILALFKAAVDTTTDQYDLDMAKKWASTFPRIDENVLDKMQAASRSVSPGPVLLRLCTGLMKWAKNHESFASNLEMQKVHSRLSFCQRHLRSSLLILLEMQQGYSIQELFIRMCGPDADTEADIIAAVQDLSK